MGNITLDQTIAELVLERPARSRVFESLGIDYCCGGKKTIQDVCTKKQLEPERLLALLDAEDANRESAGDVDFDALSLAALIENIIEMHHDYLRAELPRLEVMLSKVSRVHVEKEPRLERMQGVFAEFTLELLSHMMKEERILFPAIARMEQSGDATGNCFGSVAQPIAQMESEHENAGSALEALRVLSDGYTPPEWACNTYRAMLDGLQELEQNMHLHVHKENNILFPKAILLEEGLRQEAA